MADDFDEQVVSLAALGEPVRRALYRYVISQPEPVSRDRAAAGVGVAHHVAKFHLDKLEDDGLLEAEYARPPGRGGPGAGRPAKLYRRAARQIAVSLPERRYDLAGHVLAEAVAVTRAAGVPIDRALADAARAAGRAMANADAVAGRTESLDAGRAESTQAGRAESLGAVAGRTESLGAVAGRAESLDTVAGRAESLDASRAESADVVAGPADIAKSVAGRAKVAGRAANGSAEARAGERQPPDPLAVVAAVLAENGYEPRVAAGRVTLGNCPFHRLAREHTELVCTMNLDLIAGLLDALRVGGRPIRGLRARLDPGPGRCCVTIGDEPGHPPSDGPDRPIS